MNRGGDIENCVVHVVTVQPTVRETIEKAFWDGIMDSLKQDKPDFSWVLKLMKEVRDELCDMSPQSWRQEIVETIDIDILSEVGKPVTTMLSNYYLLLSYDQFRLKVLFSLFLLGAQSRNIRHRFPRKDPGLCLGHFAETFCSC